MSRPKPICQELRTWLRDNLGREHLAALTSVDNISLDAAVHVAELWSYHDHPQDLATAFGAVVRPMQRKTQYLAYHAIAMVSDWHLRSVLWVAANLPALESGTRCKYEPQTREGEV